MTRSGRWAVAASVWVLGAAVAVAVLNSSFLSAVQLRWNDSLQPGLEARSDVVVVAIDRESLAAFGDGWPWPRERHAQLVSAVAVDGPAVIAIDVLFADPRADDDALAAALVNAPTVLVSALGLEVTPDALPLIVEGVQPADQLAESAAAVGHANIVVSDAGVVRRVPLVAATERGALRPSLALAAIAVADGSDQVITERPDGVQVGARFVPLDHGLLEVNYSGALDASSAVSAIEVLNGDLDASVFAGKMVIIGVTEPTLGDLHATPVDRSGNTAGVFVLANTVNTIATAGYLTDAPSGRQDLVAVIVILVAVAAMLRLRLSMGLVVALVLAACVVLWSAARFHSAGEHWDIVGPLLGLAVAAVCSAGWRYLSEIRHRRRAWRLFASYVPPNVVAQLEDPSALEAAVAGARVPVTVLFCDLRGFTPLASSLDPGDVRAILDHYYATMVGEIHRHGGTVVQFVGDEVFAVWGAPVADHLQCARATECALAMQAASQLLDAELAETDLPPLVYGIGMHHGTVVAAHVGTAERRQYAVVGDTVNVGSRLCGQALAGEVVVSETLWGELTHALVAQFGGPEAVVLKGVAEPVGIRRASAKVTIR